jgi:hypothetical protein
MLLLYLSDFSVSIPRKYFLENRTITTDTVHDPADAIEADTLTHMLNKGGRISMASNKAADRILNLDGHLISFSFFRSIIPIGF